MIYLVLDIGCAECHAPDDGSLVRVLGYADTARAARELAKPVEDKHNWVDQWEECEGGWYATARDGELRIITLDPIKCQIDRRPHNLD